MNAICLRPGRTGRVSRRLLTTVLGFVVACDLAAVAAIGDEVLKLSKPIASQPVKVQVSENWTIEIIPGPATVPAPVLRAQRLALNEAQQKVQPVRDQPRGHVDPYKSTNDCRCCCCAPGSVGLNQITLKNIIPLGLYYDNRNLPPKGRWRP